MLIDLFHEHVVQYELTSYSYRNSKNLQCEFSCRTNLGLFGTMLM